jgi:transcriptional regulator with XRE-family HTH domain
MRGMNQVDLARASGVAQNTISEIELGKREARPGTLKKLADALGVGIADLLGDTPPKAPARSSPEPSLFSELEDERRKTFVQSCNRYAESRAKSYEISSRTLTQEGGVFAGPEGARILFVAAYEEYVELRPLVGRDLAFLFDEGLSEYEASRFSGLTVAALRPLAETVERLADRAAELAETEAQKAAVERRRAEVRLIA